MSNTPGGKGDGSRPFSVPYKQFASNWDAIFSKDKSKSPDTSGISEKFSEIPSQNTETLGDSK